MTEYRTTETGTGPDTTRRNTPARRMGDETKPSFKTTELIVYVAAVVGVLIASAIVDEAGNAGGGFEADQAWLYVTLLTIGYMVSRGLAKSGSRSHDHDGH